MVEWCDKNGEIVDGRTTYQIKKLRAALNYTKSFRVAVDVGAHVGFWSMHLAKKFWRVEAFEPVAEHRECFLMNAELPGVSLHPVALGSSAGNVELTVPPGSSGGTHISGDGDIEMRTLDSYAFIDVDFIKIDCEGYELEVLKGAEMTIRTWRPCVIVEQKPHKLGPNFGIKGTPAVDNLTGLGAVVRKEMSGDFIMSFD
jgi:FkbM family methyltransferase